MTAAVLLRLASVFDADLQQFSAEDADRLVAQLRDALTDPSVGDPISMTEIRELAVAMPAVGRYVMELHRRYRHGRDVNETIMTRIDASAAGSFAVPPPMAYEEVQELFYARRNYFPALDLAAEQIAAEAGLEIGNAGPGITERLARRHGIRVTDLPAGEGDVKRRYDAGARVLSLSPLLNPGQRAFQLATHLASVEMTGQIDEIVADARVSSDETRLLTRIGLASYFAGAMILPYRPFLDAAEELGYDIMLLQRRFHVGYETVAHRLSTLQRPGAARRAVHLRAGRPGRQHLQAPVRHQLPLLPGRRLVPAVERLRGVRAPRRDPDPAGPDARRPQLPVDRPDRVPPLRRLRRAGQDVRHRPGLRPAARPAGWCTRTAWTWPARRRWCRSGPAARSATGTPARSAPSRPSASPSTPCRHRAASSRTPAARYSSGTPPLIRELTVMTDPISAAAGGPDHRGEQGHRLRDRPPARRAGHHRAARLPRPGPGRGGRRPAGAGGIDASPLALDVTDPGSVTAAAAAVGDRYGRLDILVNNAGISLEHPRAAPSDYPLARLEATYATNVFGVVTVTNAFLPLLRRSRPAASSTSPAPWAR